MTDTDRVRHNWHRMKILTALNEHAGVGNWVEFGELANVLDVLNTPMVSDQLTFHLRYCTGHGWIELRTGRTKKKVNAILAVKLTVAGVDRIDIGRMPDLEATQKYRRKSE